MSIQLFQPKFRIEECLDKIRICLERGWTGIGFLTDEFEVTWKAYTNLPYAFFMNSATAGLNAALHILKQENGWDDTAEIITTPLTFVSTNHAILREHLIPVFADVDDTLTLSPQSVSEHITERTKAIMFVGMGGNIGNYYEILDICKKRGLKLILDAAHMAGTRYNGSIPGAEADAVVYSFQAVKNLPTADSGMLCFKEEKYDAILRKYSWLGINKNTYNRSDTDKGTYKWKYDVEYVGEKIHGNSIMAAIGLVQLKYLDEDNECRKKIGSWYHEKLNSYGKYIQFVKIPEKCESSNHLFQIIVPDRDGLLQHLNNNDIYPGVHYVDNTIYRMYNYAKGTCSYASYISDHILSLPMHLHLTREDITYICNIIISYIKDHT